MSQIALSRSDHTWRYRFRAIGLHAFRWALLVTACWLIRSDHSHWKLSQRGRHDAKRLLPHVVQVLPRARVLQAVRDPADEWQILDEKGETIGVCLTTSPTTDDVVGFSGPTNVLLVFDDHNSLRGLTILGSQDTAEHVRQVRQETSFFRQLVGKQREELARLTRVDAVSGATLTSLAIIEAIRRRSGGSRISLRFPDSLTVADARRFFPAARALRPEGSVPGAFDVLDDSGQRIGKLYRTSPIADPIVGYQGPTDAVFAFDSQGSFVDYRIRKSYDNQPYVRYVDEDRDLRYLLRDKTLSDFAGGDTGLPVEGVSGATMTSQALLEALRRIAQSATQPKANAAGGQRPRRHWHWSAQDWGTLSVVIASLLVSYTRLRRMRRVRTVWLLVLFGYFGCMNGDMLSQALLVGWVQNGVPWERAPALTLLVAMAFLLPASGKGPWYCHAVCPFGAAQELLWRQQRIKWPVPRLLLKLLKLGPATVLVLVLLAAFHRIALPLAALEPFHAFLWPVAGMSTLAIAVLGLVASLRVPKAYCRFGCPTGAVLEYGRWTRTSAMLRPRDWVAAGLVGLAILLRVSNDMPLADNDPRLQRSPATSTGHRPNAGPATASVRFPAATPVHLRGVAMGTTWEVSYLPVPDVSAADVAAILKTRLQELDREFSHWRADSVVSNFNQAKAGAFVPAEFAGLIRCALDVHRQSRGTFDITAAPLVRLWGFGPNAQRQVPTGDEVQSTLARVGSNQLALQADKGGFRLQKTQADLEIDVSALAKGFAVDRLAEELQKMGIHNALVGVGGEFMALGKAGRRPWHVGIEHPSEQLDIGYEEAVALSNMAIATSGGYRQYVADEKGRKHSHVIDPRTGYPVENGVLQVSVIAPAAMLADAWATALMAHAPNDALRLADRYGLAVRLVQETDQGRFVYCNAAFAKRQIRRE